MHFYIINKKHILAFILFLLLIFLFLTFYSCFATQLIYSNNNIISSENSISIATQLQSKLDNLYYSNEKIAFLTFDDGPTKIATTKTLDILKNNDVHANFFVIGYRVKEFPDIVKRAYNEGHFIANHGYSHNNSKLYKSKDSFINEIVDTDKAISDAIGISNYCSHIFRFPNGSTSNNYKVAKKSCINYLKEISYGYLDWNSLNNDSVKKYSSTELLNNLKKTSKDKSCLVVLMHDTSDVSKSYESLDASIKYLKEQGYTFKTFYDIIQDKNLK